MAQYQITLDSEILQQLFIGNAKDSGVNKLLESVLTQVLKAQMTEQINAENYERTDDRKAYRNGNYPHQLTTRVGAITLHVPRLRDGKVSLATEEICGTSMSKSTVSELCKRLDPIVIAWNTMPLSDTRFPFVLVDALYLKVREVLGLMLGDTESEESWSEFFVSLKSSSLLRPMRTN